MYSVEDCILYIGKVEYGDRSDSVVSLYSPKCKADRTLSLHGHHYLEGYDQIKSTWEELLEGDA